MQQELPVGQVLDLGVQGVDNPVTLGQRPHHLGGATQEDLGRLGQVLSDHAEQFDDLGFDIAELTIEFLSFPSKGCHGQSLYALTSRLPAGPPAARTDLLGSGQQDYPVTLTRNSHALITPPAGLATAAGISQYKPLPALTRKVSPATPTSTAVIVLGENLSMYRATS